MAGHGRSRHGLWRVYAEEDIGRSLPGGNRVKAMETRIEVLAVRPVWGALHFKEGNALGPHRDPSEEKPDLGTDNHHTHEHATTRGPPDPRCKECGHLILLRASPKTGRTHQIRLHCSFLDVPLIGDVKYGGVENVEDLVYLQGKSLLPCSELGLPNGGVALHAAALSIRHPRTHQNMNLLSPPPLWASFLGGHPYPLHGSMYTI